MAQIIGTFEELRAQADIWTVALGISLMLGSIIGFCGLAS